MVGVFERVFEVGPVFRAEPHDTPRHLNEYVSLDVEMGFIGDHTDVMALVERVLRGMLDSAAVPSTEALALARAASCRACRPRSRAIHFAEAQALIARRRRDVDEPDLAPAHERWLGEWAAREHGSRLPVRGRLPDGQAARSTPTPIPSGPSSSNSFDLLFRGLELVTGGQRLHRYEDYLAALAARGQDQEPFAGYLEAFAHGMPPHGGFAIGLERWVARLVGAPNIRETTLFPRDLQRLTP